MFSVLSCSVGRSLAGGEAGESRGVEYSVELGAYQVCRLGLHRVFGTCGPRNLVSARVLGRLGMTWEGRHRHTALIWDGWRDS